MKKNKKIVKKTARTISSAAAPAPARAPAQTIKRTFLDRLISGHLYLLVFLLPMVFWLDTQTVFTLPKLLLLRTVSLSALLLILFKFFRARQVKLFFPRKMLFLGFFFISIVLSTIFSINHISSLFGQYGRYLGFFTFINFLLIPVYIANFFPAKSFRKLLAFSALTAVLVAFYGLLQYLNFFDQWPLPFEWTDSPQNRVFATMGHANHLAAYLAAHFLILTYSLTLDELKHRKLLFFGKLLGLLLIALVITLTASRGAVIALLLSALILVGLRVWKYRANIRKKLLKIVVSAVAVVILLSSGLFFFSEQISELSLVERTSQTLSTVEKGIIPDRLSFLYSSWQMFLDHPLLGTGFSTFRDAYSAYRRADYYIDGPGNAQYITVPESAHNEYANILATQGLLGIMAYLALIIVVFRMAFRQYFRADHERGNYYLALIGGLLVFCFQTLFNFGEIVNWFFFFLWTGMIMTEDEKFIPVHFKWSTAVRYSVAVILILLIVFSFKTGVLDEAQADYYYKMAIEAQSSKQSQTADQYFQMAIAARPLEYQLYQAYADFSMEAAYYSDIVPYKNQKTYLLQAAQNYLLAAQRNPNYPSTWHNLGLAYLQLYRLTGDQTFAGKSNKYYQVSIKKSPNNPRYLYEFARKLHSDWNDREGAVKLLKESLAIAPDYQESKDYLQFLYKNHPELETQE